MQSLVFVHGYLGGSEQWKDQVKTFSKYFNVITPDLPGFGLNAAMDAPETVREFTNSVLNALDQQGIEKFHLVGHSMGGMIAQDMVAVAPEKVDKLVLYGTGPVGVLPGRFETLEESRRKVIEDGVAFTGKRIASTWFVQGDVAEGYPVCAELATRPRSQAATAALSAMETWSGVESLGKISCTTLVLWGDQDRTYSWSQPEQLWKEINNASLAVIPGCSHAVHLENPVVFNTTLMDFLLPEKERVTMASL